jgi:flagellar hook-associated protein 3 FlgL
MTTITPFAAGSYLTARNASNLTTLKNQLNDLSNQVSSGKVATTYGGLGSGRSTALAAQATLSALTGYAAGIGAAQTRTNLAVTSLTQVATIGTSARDTLNNGLQSAAASSVAGRATALSDLQTALDTLNQSAAGNYLFGGGNATTPPVADVNTILSGTTNSDGTPKLGLQGYIAAQVKADLGSGMGRLTVSPTGNNPVVVSEPNDATRGTFGFTLGGATSSAPSLPTAITATPVAGTATTPGTVSFNVNTQPAVGDSVTVTLQMSDKTSTTLTLTAVSGSSDPAATGMGATFKIGANTAKGPSRPPPEPPWRPARPQPPRGTSSRARRAPVSILRISTRRAVCPPTSPGRRTTRCSGTRARIPARRRSTPSRSRSARAPASAPARAPTTARSSRS